jgi:hypothetical protein
MQDLPDLPDLPVTFRPGATRAVLHCCAVAIFVVMGAVALRLDGLAPGERASFIVTGALIAAVLVLLARPKAVADRDGVTVVNITSRRRLAWEEIVHVHLRAGDPWVHLDLGDGTSLPVLGIQPGIARQRAVEAARTLRALAQARCDGAGRPPQS